MSLIDSSHSTEHSWQPRIATERVPLEVAFTTSTLPAHTKHETGSPRGG